MMHLIHRKKSKSIILFGCLFFALVFGDKAKAQGTIYYQNFGTVTSTTLPTNWAVTGAQASNITLNTSSASSGYTLAAGNVASGGANLADGATGTPGVGTPTVTVTGINTVGYSSINVQYAARATSTYTTTPTFYWSNDGSTWNTISYTAIPATSTWTMINSTAISLPSSAANQTNLQFMWVFNRTATTGNYRIDDFNVSGTGTPTLYYSKSTGNLDATSTWGTNTDGTGSSPSNFTNNLQIFHIVNGNSGSISGSTWTVSGSGAKIVVDGTDFTIPASNSVVGPIDVKAGRTLTLQNATLPTIDSLDPASTVVFSGLSGTAVPVPLSLSYGNITFSNSTVAVPGATTPLSFSGNFTLSGTSKFIGSSAALGYSLVTTGTGNQTINANGDSLSVWSFDAGNTNTKGSGTVTLSSGTNMIMNNSMIMNLSGTSNQFSDGGNTLYIANNLDLTGSASSYNLTGTIILDDITGGGSQNIRGGGLSTLPCIAALNNLTLNNAFPVQVRATGNTLTIKGNLTISSTATSTLVFNGNTIALAGNFIYNQTTDQLTTSTAGSTLLFNGTGAQTYTSSVSGGNTIANVTINNSAGLTLNSPMKVSTTLTLTSGVISTGSNTLSVTATGTVSGGSSSSYVNGNLSRTMPSGGATTMAYQVGDLTYSPVQLTFSSSVSSGSVTVKSTTGNHPNIFTSFINLSNFVNRYWTITSTGVSPATVNVALSYNSSDMTGTPNTSYVVRQFAGSAWSSPSTISNSTTSSAPLLANSTTATGITGSSFSGDYIAGLLNCPASLSGTTTICIGGSTTLTEGTSGGTWTSANTSVATVGTSGSVTGISFGSSVISYTMNTGCAAVATMTVNPYPITGQNNVCTSSTTTLSDATTGGSWTSSNTSAATIGTSTGVVTGVAVGTTIISYTTSTGCVATSSVSVVTSPDAITGASSVCQGFTTALSDLENGGAWTSSNSSIASIGSLNGILTGVATGTAVITYTIPCGFVTTTVTVNSSPSSISGAGSVCQGLSLSLTDGTSGGTWSSSNGNVTLGSTSGTSTTVTGITAGTSAISYIVSGCPAILAVTVNPLPANISGTTNVCPPLSVTLSDGTSGGAWSISGSSATIGTGTGTVTGVSAGSGVVTYTLGTGCLTTTIFTVNTLPVVGVSPSSATICSAGSGTTLSASGATTYTWAPSSGLSATTGASVITTSSAGTTYTVTGTNSTGCIATNTVTTSYVISPTAITISPTSLLVCTGSGTNLLTASGGLVPASSGTASGTINMTISGSPSAIETATLTVSALPAGAVITGASITINSSFGSSFQNAYVFDLAAPNGKTITLIDGDGCGSSCTGAYTNTIISTAGTSHVSTGSSPFTGTFSPDAASITAGTYVPNTLLLSDLYGGTGPAGTWTLITYHNYSGGTDPSGTLINWTVTINYLIPNVTWSPSTNLYTNSAGTTSYTGTTTSTVYENPVSAGVITYTATATNGSCASTGNVTATVNNVPSLSGASTGGTICAGATLSLFANSPANVTGYSWAGPNLFSSTLQNPTIGSATVAAGGVYTVTVNNGSGTGCAVSYTTTATVNPVPVATVPSNQTFCNSTIAGPFSFSSTVTGTTYAWTNSLTSIGVAASGSGNPIASFTAANSSTVAVTAIIAVTPTANTCIGSTQNFTVTVNPTPIETVPSNQTFCNNTTAGPFSFSSTVAGTTYSWTNGLTSIGLAASGTSNPIASFTAVNSSTVAAAAVIAVTPTANSCAGATQSFTVTVNPTPVETVPANQTFCNNTTAGPFSFSSTVAGTTYSWANSLTSIGLAASGSSNPIVSFTAANSSTVAVTAVIAVTPTANSCVGSVQNFTVTVNPTPIETVPSNQTFCNTTTAGPFSFSSTVAGTTYSWTNGLTSIGLAASGTSNPIPSFTTANSGTVAATAVIAVAPTANACVGATQSFTVTVNPTPVETVPANQTYCNNTTAGPFGFSSTVAGTTYSWTNSLTSIGLAASGSSNPIASFTAANSSTVAVTAVIAVTPSANACVGSIQNFTVTVNPTPIETVPANQTFCNTTTAGPFNFSSTVAGTTYSWTNGLTSIGLAASGTGNSILSFTAVNNSTVAASAVIAVTPTANACAGATQSFTVTVNPTPIETVPANQTFCNNTTAGPFGFSSTVAGTTYSWTNGLTSIGLGASGTSNPIPSFTAVNSSTVGATAVIAVTPTANTCVGSIQSFTVTVNPTPVVTVPANQAFCNATTAGPFNFSSTLPGTTYSWTNSLTSIGLGASGSSNPIPSFTATNSGTVAATAVIAITPTANSCAGPVQSFTVTVNPTPTETVPANQTFCNNTTAGPFSFSSSVAGTTYSWTNSLTSIGLAASGSGNPISSFTATNSSTVAATAVIAVTPTANTCVGSSQSFTVTVNPTPIETVPANQAFCNTTTAGPLSFSSTLPGTTYSWTNSLTSIGLGASGTSNPIPSFTAINSGSVAATAVIVVTATANSCAGPAQSFTVTVNPTPNISAGSNTTICSGTSVPLTATGGATYSWTPSTALSATTGSVVNANPTSTITYSVTGISAAGCSNAAAVTVTVNSLIPVSAGPGVSICNGSSTTLTATGAATYTWAPSVGLSATTGTTVSANPGGTIVYTLTGVSGVCTNTATVTVTVNPVPTITATGTTTICSGINTGLTASGAGTGGAYAWSPAAGLSSTTSATPTASPMVTTTYTVTGTTSLGCGNSATVTVSVNPTPLETVPANQAFCNNATAGAFNFSSTIGGTTYAWTNSNTTIGLAASGSGNIASFTAANSGAVPATALVAVTPTAGACVGTTQTFTITVNPTPIETVTPTGQNVCNNANTTTINFTSNVAATTYTWANNNTTIGIGASGSGSAIASFTATNSGNAPVNGVFTVTPTANTCLGPVQVFTVTVNPTPIETITPTGQSVCNNANTTTINFASNVPGTTYVWANNNSTIGMGATGSGSAIASFTATNSSGAPANGVFTVTPTANSCLGPVQVFTVTVNPTPIETVTPTGQSVCNNANTTTINFVSNVAGATYAWANNNTTIGIGASGSGSSIASFTATNSGNAPINGVFTVTPTANSCFGPVQVYTVTVNPTPVETVTPTGQSVCNNANTTTINFASNVSGTTYAWANNNTTIGIGASGSGSAIASFTATNSGNAPLNGVFTVTPTANSCFGPVQVFTVTVNPTPVETVTPTGQLVCNNANTTTINFASNVAGTTYAWANNNTTIGIGASGSGSSIASFTTTNSGNAPVNGVFTVTPTASSCLGPVQVFTVTVNPTPIETVTPTGQFVCNNANTSTINFVSNVTGTTFTWANNNTTIGIGASGSGSSIASFTAANSGNSPVNGVFTVTPTANACLGPVQVFTVTVNPSPIETVTPTGQSVCNNANTTTINFVSNVSGTTYAWANNNTAIGIGASGSGSAIASFTATNSGNAPVNGVFTVTPTANSCSGPVQVFTVAVNPTPIETVTPTGQSVCNNANTSAINFASNVSGTTFAWANNNTTIGIGASGSGSSIASFTATNSSNAPVNGVFTVTPTANSCLGPVYVFTVAVNPTPIETVTPTSQVVCNNANTTMINFTSNVAGATFSWANNNTTIGIGASGSSSSIAPFTGTNAGSVAATGVFTVTPTANSCLGPVQVFTVMVNPTPIETIPVNQTFCNNATAGAFNFSSTVAGTTFAWTNSNTTIGLGASGSGNIASFTAANSSTVAVTALIAITPTAATCAGTTQTFTVTVNPTPVETVPANQIFCNNSTAGPFNFSSTVVGTTYSWTNSNTTIGIGASGAGNIPSFTAVNSTTVAATALIAVTPAAATCIGAVQTFTVTIKPSPTVTAILGQTLCDGTPTSAVNFTGALPGTVYNWTNNNIYTGLSAASGSGNIASFTATNGGTTPITGTITVTPSVSGCTGTSQNFTITVNPTPSIIFNPAQTVCNGGAVAGISFRSLVSVSTFAWTNSNTTIGLAASGAGDIASFTGLNSGVSPVTSVITATPTAYGCTGIPQNISITVNPTPVVNPVSGQTFCNGTVTAAINLTGPVSGTTYSWANSNPAIGFGISGSGNIAPFIATNSGTAPIAGTITVTPSANGCTGATVTFPITINPTPGVVAPPDQVICNGSGSSAVNFTGAVSGTTYSWTNSNPSIGLAAAGLGDIASFIANNSGTSVSSAHIRVTPAAGGCTGSLQNFMITVYPTPSVAATANQTLCNGAHTGAVNFTGPVSGTVYAWVNDNPTIGLSSSGTGHIPSFTAVNSGSIPASGVITVTPSIGGCPGAVNIFTVTVNPTPNVILPLPQILCNGAATADIAFTGTVSGTSFSWTNSNTTIGLAAAGSGNIASFTAINSNTFPAYTTITVTPSAGGCTGAHGTYSITVNPTPNVVVPGSQAICNGAASAAVAFSGRLSSTTFDWVNSNPTIGLATSGAGNIASFTAINPGIVPVSSTITVTPVAATGCTGTPQHFMISVNPTPTVTAPANQVLCNGSATAMVSFTGAVSGTTYSWANDNTTIGLASAGTGDIASFTAVNSGTVASTAVITVTPAASGCTGIPETFTIVVKPLPTVNSVTGQTICNGAGSAAVAFGGMVGGITFNWTNSNPGIGLASSGAGNIASFVTLNGGSAAISGSVTVTPSAAGCTGLPGSFVITVNPTPSVAAVPDQAVCNGAATTAVIFTGIVTGTSYTWTNSNAGIGLATSGTGNIASFTATNSSFAPAIANIRVIPAANGCLGAPRYFSITASPTPDVSAPASQVLCNGAATSAVTFHGDVSGTTYTWANNNTAIGLSSGGAGNIAAFAASDTTDVPVTGVITVTPSSTGCSGASQTFTMTVKPSPSVALPANQAVCNGAVTAAVAFTGPVTGTTYTWANSNSTIGLATSGTGNIASFTGANTADTAATGIIRVTPAADGCTGATRSFDITVNPIPAMAALANLVVCSGDVTTPVNFTSSVTGTTYTWINTNPVIGLAGSGIGSITSFTAQNATATPETSVITVTPSAAGCVGAEESYTVTVYPTPTVVVPADLVFYSGAITLPISFTGFISGAVYTWTNNNISIGLAATGTGTIPSFAIVDTNEPITAVISVTPKANGCTGATGHFKITVLPPDAVNTVAAQNNQMLLYPNPANNILNVKFTGTIMTGLEARLFDISGKQILFLSMIDSTAEINVGNIAPGVYSVGCYQNGLRVTTATFIKQ